jgi:starch-binding outer membrane protein, SusD/RagB family
MKSNKLLILIAASCLFFSCTKLIDGKETDLIAGDVALKTVENCEQGLIGAYAALGVEMGILMNSTFSDEVRKGDFYNAGTTHEWQYTSTDVGLRDNFTAINPNYSMINRVNAVLKALPNADSTRVGDISLKNRIRGEALFLRAYAHFELFRYYCGNYTPTGLAMPYMEASSLAPQARIKMDVYFQKMNADIAAAKPLVAGSLTDINRANIVAVSALQARIALYTKDWANAVTYSTEYINALPLSPRASFAGLWSDANTNEVAFRLIRTLTAGGRIGGLYRAVSANATPLGIGSIPWTVPDKLWNAYDQTNDIRFSTYFKNEPTLGPGRPTRLINKYAGTGYGTTNELLNNAKVYRTGEMYLIRAEARAELGAFTGANSAESDINTLRAARITGYTNVVFATKQQAIDAMMNERFVELPFEGHRFWDLKRREMPVVRLAADAPTTNAATLPANDYRFILPIPNSERQSNPLMDQNPGYQ